MLFKIISIICVRNYVNKLKYQKYQKNKCEIQRFLLILKKAEILFRSKSTYLKITYIYNI
jgi:hypothetical protein